MAGEGVWPKTDGDILYDGDINHVYNRLNFKTIISTSGADSMTGILAHGVTALTTVQGGTSFYSVDGGVSWTSCVTQSVNMDGVMNVCDADKTNAMIFPDSTATFGASAYVTTDAGVNWTENTTAPASVNGVLAVSIPTTSVAVVGTNSGGGNARCIFRSTNNGDSWTICTTGPTGPVPMIDMVDGSNGIAIDTDRNIWTTSDGGDNWTDSGQDIGNQPQTYSSTFAHCSMVALTSTTGVALVKRNPGMYIETFNTTSGGTVRFNFSAFNISPKNIHYPLNLIKTTNGNLYTGVAVLDEHPGGGVDRGLSIYVLKSADSGVTWQISAALPMNNKSSPPGFVTFVSNSHLYEYTTNKLVLSLGGGALFFFDENMT